MYLFVRFVVEIISAIVFVLFFLEKASGTGTIKRNEHKMNNFNSDPTHI